MTSSASTPGHILSDPPIITTLPELGDEPVATTTDSRSAPALVGEREPLLSHYGSTSATASASASASSQRNNDASRPASSGAMADPRDSPQLLNGNACDGMQVYRNYGGIKTEQDRSLASASSSRAHDDGDGDSVESEEVQAGVRQVEAISQTWTKWSLVAAYIGIFLLAISTSLETQTTINLTAYATSSFSHHSGVATVSVVSGVVNAVIKPPMSKIANTFGRLEAYCFAVLLYICGYLQMAASQNFATFASAQIFYSAGSQGLQILQQIFIADTSSLLTRALFSSLPDLPFLVTTWIGSPIAESIVKNASWRWGYGLWAIVLPAAFAPLALSLFLNMRKATKRGLIPPRPWKTNQSLWQVVKTLWHDLDIMGLILLSAAIALLLLPLTLASNTPDGYTTPIIIAMLSIGALCWILFPAWEFSPELAPKPFLSLTMLRNRNVVIGCVMAFFYFGVFYMSVQPYFYSYLQVVNYQSITAAGRITQIFSFSSTVSSIFISLIIWRTKHFKWFIVLGGAIYILGAGLIMVFRTEDATIGQLIAPQICLGIGGGFVHVPAQVAVQAAVSHSNVAAATALFLTALEIGGAVGGAISGALWTANLPNKLRLYLPDDSKHLTEAIYSNLELAKSYPPGSAIRLAINRSYQETMHLLLIGALVFAAITIILSLFFNNVRLDEADQKTGTNVASRSSRPNTSSLDPSGSRPGSSETELRYERLRT